jgi:hypothetical protein
MLSARVTQQFSIAYIETPLAVEVLKITGSFLLPAAVLAAHLLHIMQELPQQMAAANVAVVKKKKEEDGVDNEQQDKIMVAVMSARTTNRKRDRNLLAEQQKKEVEEEPDEPDHGEVGDVYRTDTDVDGDGASASNRKRRKYHRWFHQNVQQLMLQRPEGASFAAKARDFDLPISTCCIKHAHTIKAAALQAE